MRTRDHISGYEAVDQPLYDFVNLHEQKSIPICLFQKPCGVDGKTLADTNMDLPGHLPRGQKFLIRQVNVLISGDEDCRMRVMWRGSIELMLLSMIYLRLPLLRFAMEPYKLETELMINEQCNFGVALVVPLIPPSVMRIGVELRGLLYRMSV